MHGVHRGLGGEGFGKFVAALSVKLRGKRCAHTQRGGFGGKSGVKNDPDDGVFHAGLQERIEKKHRVAAPAAAGIVGDIGEYQRGISPVLRAFGQRHRIFQRR